MLCRLRSARLQMSIPLCNGAFDIHRNEGALRDSIPFVVVVQSAQFDRYRRRVVVPLVRQTLLPRDTPTVGSRMNPVFVVDGIRVVLHTLDMVSVALDQLGEVVGTLEQEGQAIADALDELLTRSWV
jgi:toxin CcdB